MAGCRIVFRRLKTVKILRRQLYSSKDTAISSGTLISKNRSHSTLSTKIPKFDVYHIDSEGRTATYEVSKSIFYNELELSARDLRFQHSHMLSARNRKMIIRIQKFKAVICPSAVLLVDSYPPHSSNSSATESTENVDFFKFCSDMPNLLTGSNLHTRHLPFEYRVLEAIFSHSINTMTKEIQELEPKIKDLLKTLTDPTNMNVDRSLVHILLQSNASLNRFSTIVKEYCQMLDDLLECEEDMKDLCISVEPNEFVKSPSLYHVFVFSPRHLEDSNSTPGEEEKPQTHLHGLRGSGTQKYRINLLDEMEMLLDFYLKEGEEISNKVSELKQAVDDSNSAILINLDSHRNMLLRLELLLTMGMFSCTYFGMLGMAFGMNLNSSLEESPMAFWLVSGVMFFGAGLTWITLVRQMNKGPDYNFRKDLFSTKRAANLKSNISTSGDNFTTGTRTYCTSSVNCPIATSSSLNFSKSRFIDLQALFIIVKKAKV